MGLSLLWEQCLRAFLKDTFTTHTESACTVRMYESILRRFFACGKDAGLYTREDVVNFLAAPCTRTRRPPAPNTRNQRIVAIHQFYRFASRFTVHDGYGRPYHLFQGENPAEGLRHMKIEHRPRYLTGDEVVKFFSAIPRDTTIGLRDYALFLTYFLTARRKSEIANLQWGDIEHGQITDAQGSRPGVLYHFAGKGRGGQDDVAELPDPAYDAIVAYLEASGRMATIAPDDPVFLSVPHPRGGGWPRDPFKRLGDRTITSIAKKYARLAGLDERKVCVHIWRNTSAKHRLDGGESIFSINALLRHASLDQTWHYAQSMRVSGDPGAQVLLGKFGSL